MHDPVGPTMFKQIFEIAFHFGLGLASFFELPSLHSLGWCHRLHGWSLLRQFILRYGCLVL